MKTKRTTSRKKPVAIQPDTVKANPIVNNLTPTGVVRLSNMRTGRVVRMGAKAAGLLSTKYPNEYKIL